MAPSISSKSTNKVGQAPTAMVPTMSVPTLHVPTLPPIAPTPSPTVAADFEWNIARDGYDIVTSAIDEKFTYLFLEDYDAIIEPYANNTLVITSSFNETLTYYRYSFCAVENPNPHSCVYGVYAPTGSPEASSPVAVPCSAYDEYTIFVTEYSIETDEVTSYSEGTGVCIYVRREIHSLTDADRDATMDAMYALWVYDQEEGIELYGNNFINAEVLLKFHHFNSAWQDADHIHEGQAFLPQHIKMTNVFEKSMQSVDPSVCLPYWDFTIEYANGTALYDSSLFTEEWFGSMPNCTDYWWGFTYENDSPEWAAIPDGRWAYIEAPWNNDYDDLLAGYGYMRAPWSMNPSPYVSRFTSDWKIGTTLPSCASHYKILEYTSLSDFLMETGDDPHSSAHSLVGGLYGCDLFRPLMFAGFIQGHTDLMTICGKWSFIMKEMYRNNYVAPYDNCTINEDDYVSSECGFECTDNSGVATLLKALIESSTGVLTETGWTAWSNFLCTGDGWMVFPGDHLESASPSDPSFWPMHPTLERLLQAKFMSGGFENNTWHSDSETQNVCHHACLLYTSPSPRD